MSLGRQRRRPGSRSDAACSDDVTRAQHVDAASAAGGRRCHVALGLGTARVLVRRRRRRARSRWSLSSHSSRVCVDRSSQVLGHQLQERPTHRKIARRLGSSFATVFGKSLAEDERAQVFGQVQLVSMRHGQLSTMY